jgi:D-3-phosphoglycerate dehydrogenase
MPDSVVEDFILDLLEWLGQQDRTYPETMEAWRTSCPKLPVWEDAADRGLVSMDVAQGRKTVRITKSGLALLEKLRPSEGGEKTPRR